MYYYIDTIEQTKKVDAETGAVSVNEYGGREIVKTTDSEGKVIPAPREIAESKYYKKLSDVSNDLVTVDPDKNHHYYMDIRLSDTSGGELMKAKVGKQVEEA